MKHFHWSCYCSLYVLFCLHFGIRPSVLTPKRKRLEVSNCVERNPTASIGACLGCVQIGTLPAVGQGRPCSFFLFHLHSLAWASACFFHLHSLTVGEGGGKCFQRASVSVSNVQGQSFDPNNSENERFLIQSFYFINVICILSLLPNWLGLSCFIFHTAMLSDLLQASTSWLSRDNAVFQCIFYHTSSMVTWSSSIFYFHNFSPSFLKELEFRAVIALSSLCYVVVYSLTISRPTW